MGGGRKKLKKKSITVNDMFKMMNNDIVNSVNVDLNMPFEDYLIALFGNQKSMWD